MAILTREFQYPIKFMKDNINPYMFSNTSAPNIYDELKSLNEKVKLLREKVNNNTNKLIDLASRQDRYFKMFDERLLKLENDIPELDQST